MCRAGTSSDHGSDRPNKFDGDRVSEGQPAAPFGRGCLDWGREWLYGQGVFRWVEVLVEELNMSVETGDLASNGRVGLVGCCCH